MMNTDNKLPDCPVELTLRLIGDKWKVLIIRDLLTGLSLKPILDSMVVWGNGYKESLNQDA